MKLRRVENVKRWHTSRRRIWWWWWWWWWWFPTSLITSRRKRFPLPCTQISYHLSRTLAYWIATNEAPLWDRRLDERDEAKDWHSSRVLSLWCQTYLPFLSSFSFNILLILRPKWFEFSIDIIGETQKIEFSCLPYVRFYVNTLI